MNGYDPAALMQQYRAMQPGDPRMRAIRAAITEAELARTTPLCCSFTVT